MSYVVLARKWRPMKFEDVAAQEHVTTTLKNAILNDRLASAYLFSGPRGVGKTTTARIFAKAINCQDGPTPTPCNSCSSCVEITNSRSLDVFEIDGASNRGIDEVRNLRENLKYAASKGKHKIYIIDEVHMLTTEAFNALLKTLEEPPARVLFIFATTEPHKVPATILSRCQRYDFRRIPLQEIVEKLKEICSAEKIEIDDESLHLIAKKSEGSLRDSQSLLDQVLSFCGQTIKLDELSELLGIIDEEFYFECTDAIANKNLADGLQLVEKVFHLGYDMAEFLNGLAEHFRNVLVVKATDRTDLIETLEAYAERYRDLTRSFSETDLLRLIQMATETAYQIKRSSNSKLLLEMLIVKMIKMDKSVELDELLTGLNSLKNISPRAENSVASGSPASMSEAKREAIQVKEITPIVKDADFKTHQQTANGNSQRESPVRDTKAPPITENSVVSLEKVKSEWANIIDEVKNQKIHLGSFLNEGCPTGLREGTLEISFGKENGFHIKTILQNRQLIQKVIYNRTGFNLSLNCKKNDSEEFRQSRMQHLKGNSYSNGNNYDYDEQNKQDDEDLLQIPIVKKVIDLFDGELVKVID